MLSFKLAEPPSDNNALLTFSDNLCWISAESERVVFLCVLSFCLFVVLLELMPRLTQVHCLYSHIQLSRTLPSTPRPTPTPPPPPPGSVTQMLILATYSAGLVRESRWIFQSGTAVWRSASRDECKGTQCVECSRKAHWGRYVEELADMNASFNPKNQWPEEAFVSFSAFLCSLI